MTRRGRAGAKRVPLAELINAFLGSEFRLIRVFEADDEAFPTRFGLVAERPRTTEIDPVRRRDRDALTTWTISTPPSLTGIAGSRTGHGAPRRPTQSSPLAWQMIHALPRS